MVRQPRNGCRWSRALLIALLWLGLCHPALSATPALQLDVTYTPPTLSVVVQGVSLPQVLREIGAKIGFAVVDSGALYPALHVSITDTTLHNALRQLLRGESYAIVYRGRRGGAGATRGEIARIVLLGPIRLAETAANLGDPQPNRVPATDVALSQGGPLQTSEEGAHMSAQPTGQPNDTSPLGELLRIHALSGSQELAGDVPPETLAAQEQPAFASPALTTREGTTGGQSSTPALQDSDAALAMTTRLAQHNLKALVAGLTTVTQSLLDSLEQR
jgi:hypothetical protein